MASFRRDPRMVAVTLVALMVIVGCSPATDSRTDPARQTPARSVVDMDVVTAAPTSTDSIAAASSNPPPPARASATVIPPTQTPPTTMPGAATEVEQLVEDATMAIESDNFDVADTLMRRAMVEAPNDPEINFLMGTVLAAQNRFAEAIHRLDRLAANQPEVVLPVLGQTAEWLELQGDWTEAERRYRAILAEVPEAAAAHRKLAFLLMRQGQRLEAAEHLHALCRLGDVEELELRSLLVGMIALPGDSGRDELEPIGELGTARYEISQGNREAALATLRAATDSPAAFALLGRIHAENSDAESLKTWFDEQAETVPSTADHWVAVGVYHAQTGKHGEAVESFREAVELDPTDKFALISLSQSLTKLGETAEALSLERRAQAVAQTQSLGAQMAIDPARDENTIATLAGLLEALERPFESLCWRAFQVMFSPTISADERQRKMAEINLSRLRALQTKAAQP